MTNKNFIIRYILLKIILGEYTPQNTIPSENTIAKKFKCTRMHVREVYLKLIDHNILYAKQGSGYYVNENALDAIFFPYSHLKKLILRKKSNLDNIDIYDNEKLIGCISLNINFPYEKSQFTINDFLKILVEEQNFNFLKIINKFENNVNKNNSLMNKYTTIFINDNNQEIIINTFLNSNFDIKIIKEFIF